MKVAIFPFSADPVTFGHIHLIQKALLIFDKVIVIVASNPDKKYLLSFEERLAICKSVFHLESRIKVVGLSGLTPVYLKEQNIKFIIRGIRNLRDVKYELDLLKNYKILNQEVEFVNFFSSYPEISSSRVKKLFKKGVNIEDLVPIQSKFALENKMNHQLLIGVNGVFGSGKTQISKKIVNFLKEMSQKTTHINLDLVSKEVLFANDLESEMLRLEIEKKFKLKDLKLEFHQLGKIVFNNKEQLNWLVARVHPLVLSFLRKKLAKISGLVLIESAIFNEYSLEYLTNNLVIFLQNSTILTSEPDTFRTQNILKSQYSKQFKIESWKKAIRTSGFGKIFWFENVLIKSQSQEKVFLKNLNLLALKLLDFKNKSLSSKLELLSDFQGFQS